MTEFDDDTREKPATPVEDIGQLEPLDSLLGDDPPPSGDRGPGGGDHRRRGRGRRRE